MQALCVLLLKNVMKQCVFHVQGRHVSPDTAMVALVGATGELLGWLNFWLPMARSEFLLLYRKWNIHMEKSWCSAIHHMDAIWRISGCVENMGKCLQVNFFSGCWGAWLRWIPLWRHMASLSVESADVTTKDAVAVSHVLHTLPFSSNSTLSCLLSLQCWNCCWLLWEWRDQWWHSPADVLTTPCEPHCGGCPRPGKR